MKVKHSYLVHWYRNIDHALFIAAICLILFGTIISYSASPAVAERIGVDSWFFFRRHSFFALLGIATIIAISILEIKWLKLMAVAGFATSLLLLVAVLFVGEAVKGSERWINIAGKVTIQPSEFAKIFLLLVNAMMISYLRSASDRTKILGTTILVAPTIALIIMEPDFGMSVTTATLAIVQLFLSGVSLIYFFIMAAIGVILATAAYIFIPHVTKRINNFFVSDVAQTSHTDNYQLRRGLEAIDSGGLFGRGFNGGIVKRSLPDSHTDFIFPVIVEEFGMIFSAMLILVIAFFLIRILIKRREEYDEFIFLSTSGITLSLIVQYLFNIGVCLHLLPTKGTTLPFISYGGSSMIASSVAVGIIVCLTKRSYGNMVDAKSLLIE